MKYKLTNKELIEIKNGINNLANRQKDINNKWNLAKKYLEIKNLCETVQITMENILKEYNDTHEEKKEYVSFNDDLINDFMLIENDVEFSGLTLEDMNKMSANMNDLVLLNKIIS